MRDIAQITIKIFYIMVQVPDNWLRPSTDGDGGGQGAKVNTLSLVFDILGILSLVAGIIAGLVAFNSYSMRDFALVFFAAGIGAGMHNFALAVIVDACDMYRDSHKG